MKKTGFLILSVFSTYALGSAEFRIEDYMRVLQEKGVKTQEEALEQLPEEMRSNFTLMKAAEGAQKSTPQKPRAILFNQTAKFIVTFTDASLKGGQRLEMVQFRDETDSLEFHSLSFETGKPVLSHPNPSECMSCHAPDGTRNPRHIWSEYRLWHGAYGFNDDGIIPGSEEHNALREFWASADAHPRYKVLVREAENADTLYPFYKGTPLREPEGALEFLEHNDFDGMIKKKYRNYPFYGVQKGEPPRLDNPRFRHLHFMPNLRLAKLLIRLNARRVGRLLKSHPDYSKYSAVLAGELLGCGEKYWREEMREPVFSRLNENAKNGEQALNPKQQPNERIVEISRRLGLEPRLHWSLMEKESNYDKSGVEYSDGSLEIDRLVAWEIWKDLGKNNPELKRALKKLQDTAQGSYPGEEGIVRSPYKKYLDSITIGLHRIYRVQDSEERALICGFAAEKALEQLHLN